MLESIEESSEACLPSLHTADAACLLEGTVQACMMQALHMPPAQLLTGQGCSIWQVS